MKKISTYNTVIIYFKNMNSSEKHAFEKICNTE